MSLLTRLGVLRTCSLHSRRIKESLRHAKYDGWEGGGEGKTCFRRITDVQRQQEMFAFTFHSCPLPPKYKKICWANADEEEAYS